MPFPVRFGLGLATVYTLIFKLTADTERLVRFITVYSNHNGSLKGRCYGNRFVAFDNGLQIG